MGLDLELAVQMVGEQPREAIATMHLWRVLLAVDGTAEPIQRRWEAGG
jgi:hypothetical protein